MGNFYNYLIKTNMSCVKEVDCDDVNAMDCVVIFATRLSGLTKYMINIVKKNKNTKIVLVTQDFMYETLKNDISQQDEVIIQTGGYSVEVVKKILDNGKIGNVSGVIFYTLQKYDLGNINILDIASKLNKNINVYGITKDKEIYEYSNLEYYLLGLKLYLDIDNYIDKSLDLYGELI